MLAASDPKPDELALDPSVSPARILAGEPIDEYTDLLRRGWRWTASLGAMVKSGRSIRFLGRSVVLRVDVPPALVRGDVDEGYGPVADAFRRNFAERGEIGAACAVYRDGRKVVDLWGGYRDGETRAEWREDTVVVMFSTTKGVSSLALALAHSRGLLDYDAPVAAYWPEFAWRGKGEITVRQLLSHQAGLPVLDIPLTIADLPISTW